MPRVDRSEQVAPDCEVSMEGTADPDRPPICRPCFRLLCEAMGETESDG